MGFYQKRRARLVISPSPWSVNTVLLVTVFVVTSGLVHQWGHRANRRRQVGPLYQITASIRHAELPHEPVAEPHSSPSDDLRARAEQQIRSPQSLARAVRSAESATSKAAGHAGTSSATATVDQLRAGLEVALDKAGAGEMHVRVSYANPDREQASELLRAVAEEYAATFRREWQRRTRKMHIDAATAADEARRQWQLAEDERLKFVNRLLREQEEEEVTRPAPTEPAPMQVSPPAPTRQTVNPEWSRLNQHLAWLQRRHAELLVDRTPAHPDVQAVADERAEVQQALSSVPQWMVPATEEESFGPQPIEQFHAGSPAGVPKSEPAPESSTRKRAEARRQIDRLAREAEQAHDRYEQLAAAERAAWSDHLREPSIDVVFSQPVEAVSPDGAMGHLLSTSLLAGLAMMVGVGMFAAGAGMERTLGSVDQVSSLLGVPVVGAVTLPGLKSARAGRDRVWLRLASCSGGLILVVGCLGLLFRAIAS